jgi:hypothetical protein
MNCPYENTFVSFVRFVVKIHLASYFRFISR